MDGFTVAGEKIPEDLLPPLSCRGKHNEWQRVSKKRHSVLLSCMVCGSQWKTKLELFTKCRDFYQGACPRGTSCKSPHIFSQVYFLSNLKRVGKKLKQAEGAQQEQLQSQLQQQIQKQPQQLQEQLKQQLKQQLSPVEPKRDTAEQGTKHTEQPIYIPAPVHAAPPVAQPVHRGSLSVMPVVVMNYGVPTGTAFIQASLPIMHVPMASSAPVIQGMVSPIPPHATPVATAPIQLVPSFSPLSDGNERDTRTVSISSSDTNLSSIATDLSEHEAAIDLLLKEGEDKDGDLSVLRNIWGTPPQEDSPHGSV